MKARTEFSEDMSNQRVQDSSLVRFESSLESVWEFEFAYLYANEPEPTSAKGFEPIKWVTGFDTCPTTQLNTLIKLEL